MYAFRGVGDERRVVSDGLIIGLNRRSVRHPRRRNDVRHAHPFPLDVHVALHNLDCVCDDIVARLDEDFSSARRESVYCALDVSEICDPAVRRTETGSDDESGIVLIGGTRHCRRSSVCSNSAELTERPLAFAGPESADDATDSWPLSRHSAVTLIT
jgi:hypothetical protein